MPPPKSFRLPDHDASTASPVFITPEHPSFAACMSTSFAGFVHEPASALPASFHQRFRHCLSALQADGVLDRHDITQPMGPGTALARTRVTRCLIGKPGSTYKYLGLRMFAHPWSGDEVSEACAALRKLSKKLEKRRSASTGTSSRARGQQPTGPQPAQAPSPVAQAHIAPSAAAVPSPPPPPPPPPPRPPPSSCCSQRGALRSSAGGSCSGAWRGCARAIAR